MQQQISLFDYLAYNSDENVALSAREVIQRCGYRIHGTSRASLLSDLKTFVRQEGEDGLQALAMIHPDRELILSTAGQKKSSSFDGFSESQAIDRAPANPITKTVHTTDNSASSHTPLLIAGFLACTLILATAIIVKK